MMEGWHRWFLIWQDISHPQVNLFPVARLGPSVGAGTTSGPPMSNSAAMMTGLLEGFSAYCSHTAPTPVLNPASSVFPRLQ